MSSEFHQRPSAIFNLRAALEAHFGETSTWLEFCFDEAVLYFGTLIANKLEEREEHTHKPIYTLQALFDICENKRKKGTLYSGMLSQFGGMPGIKIEKSG